MANDWLDVALATSIQGYLLHRLQICTREAPLGHDGSASHELGLPTWAIHTMGIRMMVSYIPA